MGEAVLEQALPICDAHHHLWQTCGSAAPYTSDDLRTDTNTGHDVTQSTFVEGHSQHLTAGPLELRSVGEVGWVASVAEGTDRLGDGPPFAAIVGHADLSLGHAMQPVPKIGALIRPLSTSS